MKYFIFLAASLTCLCFTKIRAQDMDKSPPKWELGINIAPMVGIGGSQYVTYNYLVRRYFGKENKLGAIRFSAAPDLTNLKQKFPTDSSFQGIRHNNTNLGAMALLGMEWYRTASRFAIYYGFDLGWRLSFSKGIGYEITGASGNQGTATFAIKSHSFWLAPLCGLRYNIHKRFALSLESQFFLQQSTQTSTSRFKGKVNTQDIVYYWEMGLSPYHSLSIIYKLK